MAQPAELVSPGFSPAVVDETHPGCRDKDTYSYMPGAGLPDSGGARGGNQMTVPR
jgi:hypothetical protein